MQWRLYKVDDFDRGTLGYIQLTREKDRESWLPRHVGFSIGGTDEGFIMRRSEGTYALPGGRTELQESAKAALEALRTFPPTEDARYEEWRKSIKWKNGGFMSDATFRYARDRLIEVGYVSHVDHRYYVTATTAIAA